MDTIQINHALEEWKPEFRGTFAINHIPLVYTRKSPFALVFNQDAYPGAGTHWIAIFCDVNGNLEYFDTSGSPPPDDNEKLNAIFDECKTVVYNNKRIQSFCSSVCGEYCIFYLIARLENISFEQCLNFFSASNKLQNDVFVYNFVHTHCNIIDRERILPVISPSCAVQIAKKLKN